ncbi:MAG: formate--tetrahydrofolate ligase [Candidatus Moranbacteria bacterium RIFOXYB1_FULL_43_19]|nr:MAG: formate--tetrahydrofolate ligase [Candidatus Moranbacteria bacterium RIFOXYB1_FULL_43_19]OGI33599.1 MAG: formate--tetrahydrofolate ligase [Candidatus Moranbacteria bacterium RIFOXYC1_FULL_44_13]OGI37143.1 MAG: formate--tetrahydrofolate ligase [Candidatus Moranbacteria bacterium RIFOXYD1_FULL_44_12]
MLSDIQIAQKSKMKPIREIAKKIGIGDNFLELYGNYKAKLTPELWGKIKKRPDGKLILVTAITPTPAGEGKTTTSIGLAQSFWKLEKKAVLALREPSLGPSMGMKGGAAGGGYAQVMPMEDINLHFTGDIHAVTAANNLLASLIDNHIYFGNKLGIDPKKIFWKRCLDLNDRALRKIELKIDKKSRNYSRKEAFNISVASEIMAILCLSENVADLKRKLGKIVIGLNCSGKPVYARSLKAEGAMAALLKDALKPNLVQTLENTPAIIHGGPFANIAHGCNSVLATRYALKLGDYAITEAGFGADLGAEKFFDIKCRLARLKPDVAVIVATIRSLKHNGGMSKENLKKENPGALSKGIANLEKHLENIQKFGVPAIVALNVFPTDTKKEIELVENTVKKMGARISRSEVWAKGGQGGTELAKKVLETIKSEKRKFAPLYSEKKSIKDKINIIAKEIYGAGNVFFSKEAKGQMKMIERERLDKVPVCIAKTQFSLSDDPKKLGRPQNFTLNIREIRVSNGAGFIVAIAGEIMTMPGLPKSPAAERIDVDGEGRIKNLF